MTDRTLVTLEYDKVLSIVSEFAILKGTKKRMLLSTPFFEKESVLYELDKTEEAYKLLFDYGTGSIEFFDEPGDEIERAEKGASLTLGELIRCARVLKASRIIRNSFSTVVDPTISILPNEFQLTHFNITAGNQNRGIGKRTNAFAKETRDISKG